MSGKHLEQAGSQCTAENCAQPELAAYGNGNADIGETGAED